MANDEGHVLGQLALQTCDRLSPGFIFAVGHVGMHQIVGEIADEGAGTIALENEQAVVVRFGGPDVDGREGEAGAEVESRPVADALVGEDALYRPLVAEWWSAGAVLLRVVAAHDVVVARLCDDRTAEGGG